jgi:2-polyprenyl-6-methoxyphenol hydroxylase-like FAD-dependent oxidoreductase/ABC-type nitrate/sulfonate/bicarbonate transport system substrate-binding protein
MTGITPPHDLLAGPVDDEVDVLVVGGGPVGSSLGIELGRRGVSTVVAERYTHNHRERGNIRGRGLSMRSMEHLRRWGIAADARALSTLPAEWPREVSVVTALTGHELIRLSRNAYVASADLAAEPGHSLPQHLLTDLLQHTARDLGTQVWPGWQVVRLAQDGDGVTARLLDVATGRTRNIRAQYAVGADGGRSLVRQVAGIDREESEPIGKNLSVSLHFPDAFEQLGIAPNANYMLFTEEINTLFCPYNAQEWGYAIGPVPVDFDWSTLDLAEETRRRIGRGADFEILWSSPYPIQKRVARTYRAGRLFLAGDAAHLFPPYLGQNMNTGIDDAVNLGWKLAAVVQGWGGEELLDSYSAERRPIGWRNASASVGTAEVMVQARDYLAGQGIPRGDDPAAERRRRELGDDIYAITHREWNSFGIVLDQRYDRSPVVVSDGSAEPEWDPTRYRPDSRPGHRAPHVALPDGRALYDLLGPEFTLLDLGPEPAAEAGDQDAEVIAKAAARAGVPMDIVRPEAPAARAAYGHRLVLVRPDQHVAWRGDAAPPDVQAILDTIRGVAPGQGTISAPAGRRGPVAVADAAALDTIWYSRCPVPTASAVAIGAGWLDREFAADNIAVRSLRDSGDSRHRHRHYTHDHPALFREGGIVPPLVSLAHGARLRLLAVAGVDQFHAVVALPGSGIGGPADLAGRRIAIPRRPGQPVDFPRPLARYYLAEALSRAGLTEDDVRLIDIVSDESFIGTGAAHRTASLYTARDNIRLHSAEVLALIRGQVDAIVLSGGHGRAISALIGAEPVIELSNSHPSRWQPNHLRILTASSEIVQARPDLVTRYLATLLAAAGWAAAHPGAARRIVAAEEGLAEEWVAQGYHPSLPAHLGLGLKDADLTALDRRAAFFYDHGFLDAAIDLADWVSPEPLAQAQQLLSAGPAAPPESEDL